MIEKELRGNQIIAKFIGGKRIWKEWNKSKGDGYPIYPYVKEGEWFWELPKMIFPYCGYIVEENHIKFHEKWDALMYVVNKIEHSGYRFYLESHEDGSSAHFTDMEIPGNKVCEKFSRQSTIDAVFSLCVEFIIWHSSIE